MQTKRALILFTRSAEQEAMHKSVLDNKILDATLYSHLIRHSLHVIDAARKYVAFDVFIAADAAFKSDEAGSGYYYIRQDGQTFEHRIKNSLTTVFEKGYQQVILIGNDCPDLSASQLADSFCRLNDSDVVVGPAADGGIYLIGMSGYHRALFDEISWYSGYVHAQLLSNMGILHLKVYLLEKLCDIDSYLQLICWCRYSRTHLSQLLLILCLRPQILQYSPASMPFSAKKHRLRRYWQKSPPIIC